MRICSITPHQLLNNPRIVREAQALAAAGHDVRVVAVRLLAEQSALDRALAAGQPWRLEEVNIERVEGRARWLVSGVRQKVAKALWRRTRRGRRLATLAYARTAVETTRLILREPPELIIAHTHPMLGVAQLAASRLGCRWGFDCEDVLSEEIGEGIDPAHKALVRYVEQAFIPNADYVTVASPEFGRWLSEHLGVSDAVYVANTPSIAGAPLEMQPGYPDARPFLSLYWFSISLGPHRGIEDILRALPFVKVPVRLHLRGRVLPGFGPDLRRLIEALGVADRVVLHELTPPHEVVRAAAEHDIGLVLTQPCCENHEMAVPNKIYTYMLAGLAVGATATRGHRSVLGQAPGVSFEYQPGDHRALAACINDLARDPDALRRRRAEAFRLARTRFNWEVEQRTLVDLIARMPVERTSSLEWQPART
jgi:glycosyltransferase involved in cell wall biosynthesis